ncbi:MAG: hypothetical protein JWM39_621 [Parcubacteria group bacterium]|jgi:hypothetical protein|nr:hypothetical protein [Parcubacteria group bacterium]
MAEETDVPITKDDLVRKGPNLHPYYEVVWIDGEEVWLRNANTRESHVCLLSECTKIELQPIL